MAHKTLIVLTAVAALVGLIPLTAAAAVPTWPGLAPEITESHPLTATVMELKWRPADPNGAAITGYEVYVDNVLETTLGPAVPADGWFRYNVPDLNTNQAYEFDIVAVNGDGSSQPLTINATMFDPPDWGDPDPFDLDHPDLTVSNLDHDSVRLSWPAATDVGGAIQYYQVYGFVQEDPSEPEEPYVLFFTSAQLPPATLHFDMTGLDPETGHYFMVIVTDTDFAQAWREVLLITEEAPPPPPITAPTVGAVDPSTGRWHLRKTNGSVVTFFYGNPGDYPFMGDWDCDGIDTPGLYRQSDGFVYLRNANTQGNADIRFFFGNPGDVPIAGDFDDDCYDTVSIYRPSEARFYIINELGSNNGGLGAADFSFLFGNLGDKPFTGDFNGDGVDSIGLHRESTGFLYFRNSNSQGIAQFQFFFGNPGDRLIAGDWGLVDLDDTPAVFRPGNTTWYFRHTNTQGNANSQFQWGQSHWLPVSGHFGLG